MHIVRGIYVTELDSHLGERQFSLNLSRFGYIEVVCFPRNSPGTLEGHAMLTYSSPQEADDAVFGMHGTIVGDRDMEVRLLDRVLKVPNTVARGQARGGDDIWMCAD